LNIEKTLSRASSGQWNQKHAAFAPASQKLFGFRLRSPLLWRGTVPAQPSNGFFIPLATAEAEEMYCWRNSARFRDNQSDHMILGHYGLVKVASQKFDV